MAAERYVVLGVAQVRSPWFREVARWATSAMLPDRVRQGDVASRRCASGCGPGAATPPCSSTTRSPGVDRDLVELAREGGCAVLVVDSGPGDRGSGVSSAPRRCSRPRFGRDELLQVLAAGRDPDRPDHRRPRRRTTDAPTPPGFRGRLVAVTGAGGHRALHRRRRARAGSGQRSPQPRPRVPGRPRAARRPGDAPRRHRRRARASSSWWRATAPERRRSTTSAASPGTSPSGGYHLLLGLRRHRDWTAVRPRAFAAGLDGLRRGVPDRGGRRRRRRRG